MQLYKFLNKYIMVVSKLKQLINDQLNVDIDLTTRQRNYVEARGLYFTILKNNTNLTLADIGKSVNRDHTTVLYCLNNFDDWVKQNPYLAEAYNIILKKVDVIYHEAEPKDIKRENADLKYQNFQLKRQVKRLQKELST